MKIIKAWYLLIPTYTAMSLFFGTLGIHLALGAYFDINIEGALNINDGFYTVGAVFLLFMSLIMSPSLYWLSVTDGAKYVEKIKIPTERLDIKKYTNVWVVTVKDQDLKSKYAWVLKKSSFGYDLKKHGYITFYNYYYADKRFKEIVLPIGFIKE